MWYLTNKQTQHVYYLVTQSAGHTVGRVKTDLVIQNDDSISRQHAQLQPDRNVLKLTDTGSRYGTYVNENIAKVVCIRKDEPTELKEGDTVQFGRCGSLWTVGRVKFRCLTSTLTMTEQLRALLQRIGVELLPMYTVGLTHLIMPTITVTTKFLQCLVGQVPVVSPAYFEAVNSCISTGTPLPSASDFVPACTEREIKNDPQMFHPNAKRRQLFKEKEFIFFNTIQCKQYEEIIKLAGGVSRCAQREKIAKSRFVQPNVVTIKLKECVSSQTQSQSLDTLDRHVTARGLRMVPEVEIGLAILYSSTERYCNPDYNFAFNVEDCDIRKPDENEEILAKNSMNTESVEYGRTRVKIEPETIPETEPNTADPERAGPSSSTEVPDVPPSRSLRSVAQASIPRVTATTTANEASVAPRRSKRLPEATETKVPQCAQELINDRESFQVPKRPRRNLPVPSGSTSSTVEEANSHSDESFKEPSSEINIPETQPSPQISQPPAGPTGFLTVNRKLQVPEEQNPVAAGTTTGRTTSRRRANMMQQAAADDDDLFNFDAIVPRKKPRAAPAVSLATRTSGPTKPPSNDADDLFSAEDNLPSQRRRAATKGRNANSKTLSGASQDISSSNGSKDASDSATISQKCNGSMFARFRSMMKPIETSTTGWLSATMSGLSLKSNEGDRTSSSLVTVKKEPYDSSDCLDGSRSDDKGWLVAMENIIQVQEKSMQLVVHLPPTLDDKELNERSNSNGVRNFKAFVKKRQYKAQQQTFALAPVCGLNENDG